MTASLYEDLYSSKREVITSKIFTNLVAMVEPKGLIVEKVLLRNIDPPRSIKEATEKKIAAQQAAEAMTFVLAREKSDADRKVIEAEGIAAANQKISHSLTPEYLQWYYVKAIEGLAHSTNTTFFIAPFDSKLVPQLTKSIN